MASVEPPIFFVHVMKTAGTTFFFHLRARFGAHRVFPEGLQVSRPLQRGGQLIYFEVAPLLSLTALQRGAFRVFAGHYPFVVSDMLGLEPIRVALLRDPVERTISFLRHAKQHMAQFEQCTAEQIYGENETFERFIHNHQAKVFSMNERDELRSILDIIDVDDARLEVAKANLARIDILGLQEDFSGFMSRACDLLGMEPNADVQPQRMGTVDLDVSDALRERIAEDNSADVELYRHASELHRQRTEDPETERRALEERGRAHRVVTAGRRPVAEGSRRARAQASGPEYFLCEVPMTEGDRVTRSIRAAFDPDEVYPFPTPTGEDLQRFVPGFDVDYLLRLPDELWREVRAVCGPFPFVVSTMLGCEPVRLVVLRDPVERVVEQVCFRLARLPEDAGKRPEDIYGGRRMFDALYHNHQAKLFAMTPDDPLETYLDPLEVDEARLEVAKENLERVDVVGLTEEFDDFGALLSQRFGWDLVPPKRRGLRVDTSVVSESLRRQIRADNAADIEFYEYARTLVARRRRA